MTNTDARTWTAIIKINGYQPVEAPRSSGDLKSMQKAAAVEHAKYLLKQADETVAVITLRKTTAAHGTVNNAHITVSTDGTRTWVQ